MSLKPESGIIAGGILIRKKLREKRAISRFSVIVIIVRFLGFTFMPT
jgi:hypothetical protein